jgi:hypothetical protein
MQQLINFVVSHWVAITAAIAAALAGGVVIKRLWHRQSGSSNYADQRNVRTRGDVVGRDKNVGKDEAGRP